MVEDIVDGLLSHLPRHPLVRVLPDEIAVFTCELAVLGDDERDVFGHPGLPCIIYIFYIIHLFNLGFVQHPYYESLPNKPKH